ncbi:MAG: FAD:protein FMN transferase [Bacteroidota bacterium]
MVKLARHAMACRFELVLPGDDPTRLRAAGEEALGEIERLEAKLSYYRPTSLLSRVNREAARQPVRVDPLFFELLETAHAVHAATDGAFDLTVGPLMRAWGFVRDTGHPPEEEALHAAREATGLHHVQLDPTQRTVGFAQQGVEIELGAIGKGYALDEAALILEEHGIADALLHGGTSTVVALGQPPDADAWTVAVPFPGPMDEEAKVLSVVEVPSGHALAVSSVWGKAFRDGDRVLGHVLDPRLGEPVAGATLAAVLHPSATIADALSTAFLVLGANAFDYLTAFPELAGILVVCEHEQECLVHAWRLPVDSGGVQVVKYDNRVEPIERGSG